MTISVQCDECFQSYKVRDDRAGQTLKCKSCGAKIRVPAADDEIEDLNEDYEPPGATTRKKKKPAPAKKKKKTKKSISISPGKVVKRTFGVLSLVIGGLMVAGAIYMLFAGEAPDGKKARPVYAFLVASGFLGVGKKWLTED
ncbi:hypothetical protein [uncultured Gimesia sp.]|uniref:hypothetical protein n=1 Tax=uncultured Gimesia sp. TaxID=1678688 RepID=UPI002632396F|nr:hypothetical protein [uncultured Gimesia sp.]